MASNSTGNTSEIQGENLDQLKENSSLHLASRSALRKQTTLTSSIRKSLQTCPVQHNEEKLEGLIDYYCKRKAQQNLQVIEALLYILRQLLAGSSADDSRGKGFLEFDDAYGLYASFFEKHVEKKVFRDHLLNEEYGLRVYIATILGKRYIILENDSTDIGWFLEDLEEVTTDENTDNVRYELTSANLKEILQSLDTEHDRNALKAILFATRSRKEIEDLGIKEERAVTFLNKTLNAAEEYKNALEAASDMLKIRFMEKKEKINISIQNINNKITKLGNLIPKSRKDDLLNEKEMLNERVKDLTALEEIPDKNSRKRFEQCKRRLAEDLVDENRIKRRKLSTGAPRRLDSEDEEFVRKAIEDKCTAHGRRHDTVLYAHHRVKKKDFLSIANYSLYQRGKKLIKSATTVMNRGRPRNKASRASKAHIGKSLFCAKKPPKTEKELNECTYHQRKHMKNAKFSLFERGREKHGLFLSMDDKAYLRPGTDVGVRNVKSSVIYDVTNESHQRKLPQHDFSESKVHLTPSSFRVITGHQEVISGETHVVNDIDQTLVTIRPKHFIGSSGSVWASDTILLRQELPHLFEVQQDNMYQYYSIPFHRFCASIHNCAFYFEDTTMHGDVMCITNTPSCQFRNYEKKRLSWLESQLRAALSRWEEDKVSLDQTADIARGNELKDSVVTTLEYMEDNFIDISSATSTDLWTLIQKLLAKLAEIQEQISVLNLPPVKTDIVKATDAGPGVGCSNIEVKIRDVEMARIFNSDRVNRIHRAREDSGQNESERSNASIGEALVDGGALKWNYNDPIANLSEDELQKLSIQEITSLEETAMESNAWTVADDVKNRIQDEPGPAGDFMKAFLTPRKELQFFFNSTEVRLFTLTADRNQETIPGHCYFKKIQLFLNQHVEVGELYMEYLKESCNTTSGELCDHCVKYPRLNDSLQRVPRPKPDENALPKLKYLSYDQTPITSDVGIPRNVDDYQPRAQLRRYFEEQRISLDDNASITDFSRKFAVAEDLLRKYLEHLQYLQMKKIKRANERKKNKEAESLKAYEDYNWKEMQESGMLKKLKVSVLDLFLKKHNLLKHKMKKNEKVQVINAWLSMQLLNATTCATDEKHEEVDNSCEDTDEDTEDLYSDEENYDIVTHEIGLTDSEEDEDTEKDEAEIVKVTRSGRRVHPRKFFWDSD